MGAPRLAGEEQLPIPDSDYCLVDSGCDLTAARRRKLQKWNLDLSPLREIKRIRPIDLGGHGIVFKGRSLSTGDVCAIKFPLFDADELLRLNAFFTEAQHGKQIGHQYIAHTWEVLRIRDPEWKPAGLAMEFFYVSLAQVAAEVALARTIAKQQLADWCQQLTAAMAFIHDAKRLVHRDLKPNNIMLRLAEGKSWQKRPSDLDGAVAVMTDLGAIAGLGKKSPWYVRANDKFKDERLYTTPEQSPDGQFADPMMDIFAVGGILDELQRLCREPGP